MSVTKVEICSIQKNVRVVKLVNYEHIDSSLVEPDFIFDEAWKAAVEDDEVSAGDRSLYIFKLVY